MKTEAKIRKQKYKEQLHDNYIRNLLRSKGIMNHQITQKMIDDKRASVKLKREKEEFDRWRHIEDEQFPHTSQKCILVTIDNKLFIGTYTGNKTFVVDSYRFPIYGRAWQPAPIYKP